jgi:excisionase family DNA binding protein
MSAPTKASERETYLTVRETASFLKISTVTVWRMLGDGKLKKFKVGARTLIRLRDAEALVREA